MNERITDN